MKMRKGFTLVELLIVIVIIGILAAAMLLSGGSASDSASAAGAVSEMRALKAATIMHAANVGKLDSATFSIQSISKDMEKPAEIVVKYTATVDGTGENVTIAPVSGKFTSGALKKIQDNIATESDGTMKFSVPMVK